MATGKIFYNGTVQYELSVSSYAELERTQEYGLLHESFGKPVLRRTADNIAAFFTGNENKFGLDINGDGIVSADDAFGFMNAGENTFAQLALQYAVQTVTDEDLPGIISCSVSGNTVTVDCRHGDSGVIQFEAFQVVADYRGNTYGDTGDIVRSSDFTVSFSGLLQQTEYRIIIFGKKSGRYLALGSQTITTGAMPWFEVSSDLSGDNPYIRATIHVISGFEKYRVYWREKDEQTSSYADYSGKTSDFDCDVTAVTSGTTYVMNVRAEDEDGNQFLLTAQEIVCVYAISARLAFNPNGGSGSFQTLQSGKIASEGSTGTVPITVPQNYVPTPSGANIFIGWKLGSVTKAQGQTFDVPASTQNPLSTAYAQYEVATGLILCLGDRWTNVVPHISNGRTYEPYSSKLCRNGDWDDA